MAGLNLGLGGGAGVYSSLPPSAAASPAGATISARAYGIGSGNMEGGSRIAFFGVTGVGIASTALLVYLWYSLPR